MQLSSNRGLLIRYFHHFGLSLHYINNSIRKFAAEIKTCGNPVIQALPPSEQQNGQNNNKPRKLWLRNSFHRHLIIYRGNSIGRELSGEITRW